MLTKSIRNNELLDYREEAHPESTMLNEISDQKSPRNSDFLTKIKQAMY